MLRGIVLITCIVGSLALLPTPPADCPQKLKDAENAIIECDYKIGNATLNITVVSAQLDRAVGDAAAAESQASQALNAAVNKDNLDRSKLANHQADLQNAQNDLKNIQTNCASAAPPPNCPQLIRDANTKISNINMQIDQDVATIQNDDAIVAWDQQMLAQAQDNYKAAVANRTVMIKKLQDDLTAASDAKAAALKHLEEVQQECQIYAVGAGDCPEELKEAQDAVARAGAAIQSATDTYNQQMPLLDAAVVAAQNKINALTATLNADTNHANADKQTLANDQAHLQDAKNTLANIQATCGGPAPPVDCQTQIAKAQADIQSAQSDVTADLATVNADMQTITSDNYNLAAANTAYSQAVTTRDATRKNLQTAIDTANANYKAAETHYEEVQQRCGMNVEVRVADDCQTELAQAAAAVSAAGDNLKEKTDEYSQAMPKLDQAVTQAQNTINTDTGKLNNDVNRANRDKTLLNNAKARLSDAQNALISIKTTCGGPSPPADCQQQITAAQIAVQNAQNTVNQATSTVNYDDQVVAQDQVQLTNDRIAYSTAMANRDSTRQRLQQAIDAANAAYGAAQKHYEDVQQQCQPTVL